MKTQLEQMTPERARTLLERNSRNRPLRRSVVDRISRDIESGRWHVHHQGIGLAPTFVVDGQHRLHAIVKSGMSVWVNVTNYESDAEGVAGLLVVDKNATRSDADVQIISGVMPRSTGKTIVPVLKIMGQVGLGGERPASGQFSADELSLFYLRVKEHIDWAVAALVDPEAKSKFNAPHRAAFAVGHMLDPERMEKLAREVVAADGNGTVAVAWTKAASQGKLGTAGTAGGAKATATRDVLLMCLRLIQSELLGEEPPKLLKSTKATLEWFKNRLEKKTTDVAVPVQESVA